MATGQAVGGGEVRSARLSPMRGIPWRLIGAAVLTAVLLDLPFPIAGPLPAWRTVFAWIALTPLLAALLELPQRFPGKRAHWTLGWSFLGGWLAGALWFGSNCYWVYNTMHSYANMNVAMAVLCLVLFSLFLGFWFGVFALALALVRRATIGRRYAWLAFVAIPFLWTAMELAIARIPEFPWDQLGDSQVDNGLLTQLVPWTGVYGISFVLAAFNALAVAARFKGRQKPETWNRRAFIHPTEIGLLIALAFNVAVSSGLAPSPKPAGNAMAMLVQPNLDVDKDDVWVEADWDRHLSQFQQLAGQPCKSYLAGMPETNAPSVNFDCTASPDAALLVWPESPAPFRDLDPKFQSAMTAIVKNDQAPLIVGNVGMDEDAATGEMHIFNSASVIAMDGHTVGRYDKIHLVPFGEYIPYRRLLFFAHQVTQNLSDMGRGEDRKVFRIGGSRGDPHRYGIFICYESVFADEVRQFARLGAEVFVNISDDGWYGDTSAPWQHLNMARMRAIENRRWILRDTNNGVTAAIDPYGRVRQSIPRHQVDALSARFAYNSELTWYTVHGDVFAGVCAILTVMLVLWSGRSLRVGFPSGAKAPSLN